MESFLIDENKLHAVQTIQFAFSDNYIITNTRNKKMAIK